MKTAQVFNQAVTMMVYAWIRGILETTGDPGKALDAFRNLLKKAVNDMKVEVAPTEEVEYDADDESE